MDNTTRLYHASNDDLTTKERFMKMLVDRGFFAEQAEEAVGSFMKDLDGRIDGYHFTWDRSASEYPDELYNVMFFSLKQHALSWIIDNQPNAWYRSMFE